MKTTELYKLYATSQLSKLQYKILLLLLEKERHQKDLSTELNYPKQNINKACKELISMNLISISEQIGQIKILTINTAPIVQIKGQLTLL